YFASVLVEPPYDAACCSKSCADQYIVEEALHDAVIMSDEKSIVKRSTRLLSRQNRRYFVRDRIRLLELFSTMDIPNIKQFCREQDTPRQTFSGWLTKSSTYMNCHATAKQKSLGGLGQVESIPFGNELVTFMKDVRREEHVLTTAHMITWIKTHHGKWLDRYIAMKKDDASGYNTLMRLCQRFAHRHGFSQRVACVSRARQQELDETHRSFARQFWSKYSDYKASEILNVDETGIYYDMPPRRIWAEVGGSSKVDKSEKHSDRLTAVLTIRADGRKLPILFIVHGKPGGKIEADEIHSYPDGHVYAVQEEAWMDERAWQVYLQYLLKNELVAETPSVILADNLACHVSHASVETICLDLCASLEALPPNSTSVCQPLDVGVMGPLKAKMRSLWLMRRQSRHRRKSVVR
ncbi:hypothetical protein AeRB84_006025, partial [Aphanomyces euteiches]